ncbi:hypothetical protein ACJMK2_028131 [Sinanodonta woodiana]|uniref:Fe2OG dioxygenase domain-containing protein n=1 Tax=Sinanodonta woodiana TaxID=1069815 RepID=A0ABD3X6F9_SINWO
MGIPIIDFTGVAFEEGEPLGDKQWSRIKEVGSQIEEAFRTVGFCYLKNHGIPSALIEAYRKTSKEFFEQSIEYKQKYARPQDTNFGWVALERERLNPERPGDYKEAFNFTPADDSKSWPDRIPEFQGLSHELFQQCTKLSFRIFDALSTSLELKERSFLRDCHKRMGQKSNATTLRSLFYPTITPNSNIKSGQVRCGEHSDYGSITLLFQDDVGGLEVKGVDGIYIPANPIPDTVLINIGDLMQRWTADKLIATKHRVLIPEEELKKRQCRQSLAFFVHPDDDCMITCLDGSNKYEPITSKDYLDYRFSLTY